MQKIARRKIAAYVAAQLQNGADVDLLARQTAAYLIEQKQTKQLELLIRDIEASLADQFGAVSVRIVSAQPLEDRTRQAIKEFVLKTENAIDVVIAEESNDSALVGGVVFSTPSSVFDASVRTKLRHLRALTKE